MTPLEIILDTVVNKYLSTVMTSSDSTAHEEFIKEKAQEILALIPKDKETTSYDKFIYNQTLADVRKAMGSTTLTKVNGL